MEQKKQWGAIIVMIALFAMIAFVTNLCSPMGVIVKNQFGTTNFMAMIGNYGNFMAYLVMGFPAGMMIQKWGYKTTALIGLLVGITGIVVQWLSGWGGMAVYLCGALISGCCMCILNTVVNPMLNLLGGGGNKGNQLIQVGGTLNSLTATLTPSLTGILVGTVTAETSMSNVAPLLFIGMAVFAISFVIISRVTIPEPTLGKEQPQYEHSPLAFRHTLLGVIAIFFYVGIEIGIPMHLQFYVTDLGFEGSAAIGGVIAGIYWILMMVGRATSSVISGKVSTSLQMIVVSSVAIALLLIAIFMPESNTVIYDGHDIPVKAFFIAACGLCTSIMWGGIFNLSVEGLGKYTEAASGIFMTMVVGGGIMPLIQQSIASSTGNITSYWLVIAMLAYILFYATVGCKNVNKDINVD